MGWNSLMQEFALDAFTKLDPLVIIITIKSPCPWMGMESTVLRPGFINVQIALI